MNPYESPRSPSIAPGESEGSKTQLGENNRFLFMLMVINVGAIMAMFGIAFVMMLLR